MKRSSTVKTRLPRLAVLCSGRGSNLQALLHAVARRRVRATIALVVSDQPHAYALTRARRAGVATAVVERSAYATRAAFERVVRRALARHRARYIILAGFMRILSPAFVRRYPGRILNIHPALLPAFPGAHPVRDALRARVRRTGVTVHFVDAGVDTGPVILQRAVPVRLQDTEATLLARLHRVEHQLYPRAIRLVLTGVRRLRGRHIFHT